MPSREDGRAARAHAAHDTLSQLVHRGAAASTHGCQKNASELLTLLPEAWS